MARRMVIGTEAAGKRGIAVGAAESGRAKRRKRFVGDDPRRDGGRNALAEERSQGMAFSALDIARGPIVGQAVAK